MRWIVDGNNVMGSRPDGWWRDRPGAMRRLVEELDALAAASGAEILVVFDGRPRELRAQRVEVAFAKRSGRDAADDEIVRRAAEDPAPGDLTVITSDRTLAERARATGAAVKGAGTLLRRLG